MIFYPLTLIRCHCRRGDSLDVDTEEGDVVLVSSARTPSVGDVGTLHTVIFLTKKLKDIIFVFYSLLVKDEFVIFRVYIIRT